MLEWRSRNHLATMFFFVVVAMGVFGLALQVEPSLRRDILPGILWAILSLAGTLGMGQLYAAETEERALDGLRMAPISRLAIFLAKHISLFLYLLLCALWAVGLGGLMFAVEWSAFFSLWLALILVLGLWGFAILGTLMATLLLKARFREALLPLLFLPVALPLLIIGAKATSEILGSGIPQTAFWWRVMAVFDGLFFLVALWIFAPQLES